MNTKRVAWKVLGLGCALLLAACGDDGSDKAKATATLRSPERGAVVAGGVDVEMEAKGVTIEAAGDVHEGAGHFHVIIDEGCADPGTAIAKDANHVHFGKGQSTGRIYLRPGEHSLCLQVADGAHSALAITDSVTVTVGVRSQGEWCKVAKEVDDMFTATDHSDDEFAVKQAAYGNIGRLVAQLEDAIEQVDAAARGPVTGALDWASAITGAMVEAPDERSAAGPLEEVFNSRDEAVTDEAATWIKDTCGVDIDG